MRRFWYAGTAVLLLIFAGALPAGWGASTGPEIYVTALDFENAPIRQIMKTLSEIGRQNIIVDRNISENCTIYLRDISWKDAFMAVVKMNDLIAYYDGGLIKVIKRADYEIQLDEIEKRESLERDTKPKVVSVIQILNARAEDIKATLDPLLGPRDQPSVDERTNSLVFTVSDSTLDIVTKIIGDLDRETRQVAIEVRMVTVDSNYLTEIGINWSAIQNGNFLQQNTIGTEDKLLVGQYASKSGDIDLNAVLATLINKNEAEVVSRPHVITLDNEPAIISSGQEVPVTTYDEARNTVVQLIQATTQLTVTPHILSDNRILLDVNASRRSAEGVGVGLKINTEQAQVNMITSNGETAVIGGLRQQQDSNLDSGIPILQDIPLIGQLFKYSKRENRNTDLVIFITPRIVETIQTGLNQ
jgi:type IV pilus assembly protein PilQ